MQILFPGSKRFLLIKKMMDSTMSPVRSVLIIHHRWFVIIYIFLFYFFRNLRQTAPSCNQRTGRNPPVHTFEPRHEETWFRELRSGKAQTGLLSLTSCSEAWLTWAIILSSEQHCVDAQANLRLCFIAYGIRHVFSWRGSVKCCFIIHITRLNTLLLTWLKMFIFFKWQGVSLTS